MAEEGLMTDLPDPNADVGGEGMAMRAGLIKQLGTDDITDRGDRVKQLATVVGMAAT